MRRVTLKDVAREVGISVSCTARALKGRPGISQSTTRKVQQAADKLGYRPDPMLSALSSYRESIRSSAFQGTLSYLGTSGTEADCLRVRDTGDLLRGARDRAAVLGYRMEYFNIGRDDKFRRRVWKTLRAQGIIGGVLRSYPIHPDEIETPYEGFTAINLFSQLHAHSMPTVTSHHAQSMEIVLLKLQELGYRRPGIVLDYKMSSLLHHGWLMAFRVYAQNFLEAPEFIHEGFPIQAKKLAEWTAQSRTDALIFCGSENLIPSWPGIKAWQSKGIATICMDIQDPKSGLSGIYQDRFHAGIKAVTMLHSMLITRKLSIESQPSAIMVPGTWIKGGTC